MTNRIHPFRGGTSMRSLAPRQNASTSFFILANKAERLDEKMGRPRAFLARIAPSITPPPSRYPLGWDHVLALLDAQGVTCAR
jgi:hypothetical protein